MSSVDLAQVRIRDLVARYNIAGDAHVLEAMVATFAPDARYQSAIFDCAGLEAIRAYFERAWSAERPHGRPGFRRHHLTTMQIDMLGPDTARSILYYQVLTEIGLDHSGYYRDDYRVVEGAWKIARRRIWMEWVRPDSPFVPERSKRLLTEQGIAGPPED